MKLGNFVRKTSKEAVVEGVQNIKKYYLPNQRIVSSKNPLVTNGINALIRHADNRNTYKIKSNKISTFLAASSLSHMLDGWAYLSSAFSALLSGDKGTAIHLAYYAELRSAMSILATEGIGVFDKKHIGLFSSTTNGEYPQNFYKPTGGYVHNNHARTHVFVWDAMEKWTNSAFKPDEDILKIFKVKNLNFYDWTEYFHPAATGLRSVDVVKEWLKDWCFDIRAYRTDRNDRNTASYRPQRIKNFGDNIDFQEIINQLAAYWGVISPNATDKFSLLDTYLLRKLFSSLHLKLPAGTVYSDLVENAFHEQGLHDATMIKLICFEAPYNNDHVIFSQAAKKELSPLSIIARATLLLRIAVGLVSQLYREGNVSKTELNFVWNNYGIDNGFWTEGNQPADFNSLWFDINSELGDLYNDVNSGANNELYSIRQRRGKEVVYFTQINRASLWGIDM